MNIVRKRIRAVCIAALFVMVTVFSAACFEKQEEQEWEPVFEVYEDPAETMPETEPPVQIEMPDYELNYPGVLKDVIVVNEVGGENALEFKVKLSKGEEHIFTLRYNTSEGEFVTVLEDAQGDRIPVAFNMAEAPENLTEEDQETFFAAQDAVNEIVASLVLK